MYEITALSVSEIDSVGGGDLHCRKELVLICNEDGSSCILTTITVCSPNP
jgi:hypothetical protein